MKRFDRRRFMLVSSLGAAGTVLAACGNDPDDVNLHPTMIPDVAGAPPTLAPVATPGGGAPVEEQGGGAAEGGSESVKLEAQDPYAWSTNELSVAPGQVIEATNVGFAEHDFTVDELGIAEPLPQGEPVEITIPDDVAVGDSYTFYCSVPGHRENGMEGTLTIVEAGAAPAGGEGDAQASPAAGEEATPASEATPAAESTPAAGDAAGGASESIQLEAQDPYAWSTTELEATPGQVITVTNVGFMEHDFTVDELGIAEDLPSQEPVDVTIPDDAAPGEYVFYCSVPGHRESGMEGTLTIT